MLMDKKELKKRELTESMKTYILENGLAKSSLRNLAKASDTSDRMLLHYFQDKEELMTDVLQAITQDLIQLLKANETGTWPLKTLIPYLSQMMKEPVIKPYLNLWLELMAEASKKEEPYYSAARDIASSFKNFYKEVLMVEPGQSKEHMDAFALVLVEGMVMMDALDFDDDIRNALGGLNELGEN
ncbi:TetR/AcrR family transcriptional regulator [Halobacillus fulvus]|nr:TetR/AcrR family transcriptional regulator [Halobacillus fulvus]